MQYLHKFFLILNQIHDLLRSFLSHQEDAQEEFGWKLVHGDVFRPPRKGMFLSVLIGNGVQLFVMTLVTLGVKITKFYIFYILMY